MAAVRVRAADDGSGRGDPPALFLQVMQEVLDGLTFNLGLEVEVSLTNTLAMSSYIIQRRDRVEIVLDWAHIERLLLFSDHLAQAPDDRLLVAVAKPYLEAEILLLAARRSVLTDQFVPAREQHRAYVDLARLENLTPRVRLEEQLAIAAHATLYVLYHEVGHLLGDRDPEIVSTAFQSFETGYPRLVRRDPVLASELHADVAAYRGLLLHRPESDIPSLFRTLAILVAYGELQSTVNVYAHRSDRMGDVFDRNSGELHAAHRTYRAHFFGELMADDGMHEAGPDRCVERAEALELFQDLRPIIQAALTDGVPAMSTMNWGTAEHVRACIDEQIAGVSPAVADAVREEVRALVEVSPLPPDVPLPVRRPQFGRGYAAYYPDPR